MNNYQAIFNSGVYWFLALDDEEAAWRAQEHASNCGWTLIDVIPYEKTEVLPKQLESN